jgi:alkylation response protein AidB-like acyl-CoA dehydrogenase
MDFGLSEDQRQIQRTARELLAERARPDRVRACAEEGRLDEALWSELCDLGWPGIAVAEEYGGQGLGLVELAILCEELGRTVAPVALLPTVLAALVIEQGGSAEQRQRWLPGLASGESLGALGVERDGVAELVLGAPGAEVLVLAQEGLGAPGAEKSSPSQEGAPRARVYAQDADAQEGSAQEGSGRVGAEERVDSIDLTRPTARVTVPVDMGEPLEGDVQAGLDRALVAVSAELVGVCERALDMTVAYVKERKQFGVPVGSFQAVSHRCAQMLLDTERARSATSYAAWAADADPERLPEAAAMAKASASEAGVEVTASAIQAHGGIGFTWEADVHWLYKRALLDASLLGGAKLHRARLVGL